VAWLKGKAATMVNLEGAGALDTSITGHPMKVRSYSCLNSCLNS
jgi:hypothetical protein